MFHSFIKMLAASLLFIMTWIYSWPVYLTLDPGGFGGSVLGSIDEPMYKKILQTLQDNTDPNDKEHVEALKGINAIYRESYISKSIYIAPNWLIGFNSEIGEGTHYFDNNLFIRSLLSGIPRREKFKAHPYSDLDLVLVKIADPLKDRTPVKRYFGPATGHDYYLFSNIIHNSVGMIAHVCVSPDLLDFSSFAPVVRFSLTSEITEPETLYVSADDTVTLRPGRRGFLPSQKSRLKGVFNWKEERGMPMFKKSASTGTPFDQYKLAAIGRPYADTNAFLNCLYLPNPNISNWIGNTMIEDALEGGAVTSTTTTTSTSTASTHNNTRATMSTPTSNTSTNNNTRATMGTSTTTSASTTSTNNSQKQDDFDFENEMDEKLGLELKGGDGYPISPFCLITTQARQVGAVARRSVIKDWSKPKQVVNYEQLNVSKVYHLPNGLALAYLKQLVFDVDFKLFDPKRHPESKAVEDYKIALKIQDYLKIKYAQLYLSMWPGSITERGLNLLARNLETIIGKMRIGGEVFEASKAHRAKGGSDGTDPLLVYWNTEIDTFDKPYIDDYLKRPIPLPNFTTYKGELARLGFTPSTIHEADQVFKNYSNNLNAISNLMIAEAIDAASPVRSY